MLALTVFLALKKVDPMHDALLLPLSFTPVYQNIIWGGRKMEQWRDDLPTGPVGESWEIADQERGVSVLAEGALAGTSIHELCAQYPQEFVGEHFIGSDFPLLVKIIDANDRLSVQVHPDDALAQSLNVAERGKTECWYMLGDGGELFQGCQQGTTRESFSTAIAAGTVEQCLNRFETRDGDFFFMPARTIHALGTGCLLFEVQQNCDCTFRVFDWNRVGLDGKPRQLHVEESLQAINFDDMDSGPVQIQAVEIENVQRKVFADCEYFYVEELRSDSLSGGGNGRCSIIMNIDNAGTLSTAAGSIDMKPMATYIVPAIAGEWTARGVGLRILHAQEQVA